MFQKKTSRDMFPSSTTANSSASGESNAELSANAFVGSVCVRANEANRLNILLANLSMGSRISVGVPSLGNHVANICRPRPQKQMLRIAARRVVAFVKNAKTSRDWAMGKKISNPVSSGSDRVYERDSVPKSVFIARPNPAPAGCFRKFCIKCLAICLSWHSAKILPQT